MYGYISELQGTPLWCPNGVLWVILQMNHFQIIFWGGGAPKFHTQTPINIYIYIPAPSKGCQLNPKGWLIDKSITEPFGTQTGRSRYIDIFLALWPCMTDVQALLVLSFVENDLSLWGMIWSVLWGCFETQEIDAARWLKALVSVFFKVNFSFLFAKMVSKDTNNCLFC